MVESQSRNIQNLGAKRFCESQLGLNDNGNTLDADCDAIANNDRKNSMPGIQSDHMILSNTNMFGTDKRMADINTHNNVYGSFNQNEQNMVDQPRKYSTVTRM